MSMIPAKAAGRSSPRLRAAFRLTCFRRRFTPGYARATRRCSQTNFYRRCATSLVDMSSQSTADPKLSPAGPCALVIFGASGDLTRRLLIPAVYHLKRAGLLPDAFCIIGVSRTQATSEVLQQNLRKALTEFSKDPIDDSAWNWLAQRIRYLPGDLDD